MSQSRCEDNGAVAVAISCRSAVPIDPEKQAESHATSATFAGSEDVSVPLNIEKTVACVSIGALNERDRNYVTDRHAFLMFFLNSLVH
ncbi:hypothetical protein [Tahibacter soli]|jgi:hypothetical protein|uniref:Uncharacterized protein n=1 Tax=Tahibacter soli TaxID=2983605 RepID=A0A9X3YJS9_9GAMM|nr:hypothetical protein [Tahibacter soli]MDC8013689.1 hypothetical protein [Tahibacter soli]